MPEVYKGKKRPLVDTKKKFIDNFPNLFCNVSRIIGEVCK